MAKQKPSFTPKNFVATVYGNLTPLNNSAFSKARLKIFYKGLNRNGSYIDEETAEKLLASLPGTPIVGYFRGENDDFDGHITPEENKPYGFVPETMNFNWEMNLDPDGQYRTYACADVILWTGRYPVASRIVGKSHSMELNPDTIKGEWVETEDTYMFKFEFAEFFGLCVLGNDYEPCFEGSSFYELHKDDKVANMGNELKEMFSLYKQELDTANTETGGQQMENEDEKPVLPTGEQETIPEPETTPEVPAAEPAASNEEGNGNEEKPLDNEEPETDDNTDNDSDSDSDDNDDNDNDNDSDDNDGEPDLNSQLAEKDQEISNLKAQLAELNSYKVQKLTEEKEQVIEAYSNKLTEEEINDFKAKINEYEDAISLKKEIALCILDKESSEGEPEAHASDFALLNNRKSGLQGVEAIVAKYAKNK